MNTNQPKYVFVPVTYATNPPRTEIGLIEEITDKTCPEYRQFVALNVPIELGERIVFLLNKFEGLTIDQIKDV